MARAERAAQKLLFAGRASQSLQRLALRDVRQRLGGRVMIPAEPLYVGRMSRGRTAALNLGGVGAVLRRGVSRALECDGSALLRGIELPLADGTDGGSHNPASLY